MDNRTRSIASAALVSSILIGGYTSNFLAASGFTFPQHQNMNLGKAPESELPSCGRPNDGQVHIPPNWTSFEPPGIGRSYVDPVFGCQVTRLTNSGADETLWDGKRPSLMHYYPTLSPLNAGDSLLLITSNNGAWRIKDTKGAPVVPATKMPAMNNGVPVWDASDGNSFYYTQGKSLEKATIHGNSIKPISLHTFKEYRGIVSPATADLSQDGDHIALVGQNSNDTMDAFVWSFTKQAKTSVYTTTCKINGSVTETPEPGCIHKVQLTANNLLAIQFANDGTDLEQGARLWDGNKLVHLQDRTNHFDTGYDLKGNSIFIESGNSHYTSGITNPCPGGWGLDVRQLNDASAAVCLLDKLPSWHVSYRGSPAQPWVALSFFDDRKPGPELFNNNKKFEPPSPANWQLYEDEIMLARIDGTRIWRLAHARSRSAENYWATPRAALSRDGRYVVFSSNMAYPNGCPSNMHVADECMDVYLIRVR